MDATDTGDLTQPTATSRENLVRNSPYGVWGALGARNGGEALADAAF